MQSSAGKKLKRLSYSAVVWILGLISCPITAGALSPHATDPLRVRFVTFNVNFNNSAAKIREDIQKVESRADVIMTQESKWVTIANFLDSETWAVHQVVNNGDARRGSAVAYRKSIINSVGSSGVRLGVAAGDADMLDRYLTWIDLEFTNGQLIRCISLHMPPNRYRELQLPMANSLSSFTNNISHPVIAGGDWNFTVVNDPHKIKNACGLIPEGIGIDGFFYDSDAIEFVSKNQMTGLNVNSDHHPVQMIARVYNIAPPTSSVEDWAIY